VLAGELSWAALFFLCSELQPAALSQDEFRNTLSGLAARGLAVKREDGFALGVRVAQFANHFLFPSRMVFLKAGRENQGLGEEERLTCQQAGKAFLYMLTSLDDAESIWLMGGSYELLKKAATQALERPVSLHTLLGIEKTLQEKPASPLTCEQCGSPLKPTAKFCSACGSRFEPGDLFSEECGVSKVTEPGPSVIPSPPPPPAPAPKRNPLRLLLSIGCGLASCGLVVLSLIIILWAFNGLNAFSK
jgi:hypothetical protein